KTSLCLFLEVFLEKGGCFKLFHFTLAVNHIYESPCMSASRSSLKNQSKEVVNTSAALLAPKEDMRELNGTKINIYVIMEILTF
ncbi:Hypothetical predicted protein, partial [Podarcis lilfordi]